MGKYTREMKIHTQSATRVWQRRATIIVGGLLLVACSSGSSATDASSEASVGQDASPDASGTIDASAGGDAADAQVVDAGPLLPVNDAGCLTYAAAETVCGFKSDGVICDFSFKCGAPSKSQCQINCEMASTVSCLSNDDAQCLRAAVKVPSCAALAACKWKL